MDSTSPPPESGSHWELEQRLALLGPKDNTRGFLFGTALELVRTQEGEAAHQRCLAAAGGGTFTAFFLYPMASMLKMAFTAAHELSAHYGGFDGAMQNLGFRSTPRFLDSTTGRLLLSLVGREPRLLMEGLPGAYKSAFDHGQCVLSWMGPKQGRFQYTNALPAAYFTGSVLQIFAAAHLKGQAHGQQKGLRECTVEFSWE